MSDAAVPSETAVKDVRKPTNRFALPALFAAVVLCFPVAIVLAVLSLVEIKRSRGQQEGTLFATLALLLGGVFLPGVLLLALYGSPRFADVCSQTQDQAVGVLRIISYLEENFHERNGRYGALEEIGFAPKVDTGPYDFSVDLYEKDRFLASARGKGPMEGDLLTVSDSHQVERTRNLCAPKRE